LSNNISNPYTHQTIGKSKIARGGKGNKMKNHENFEPEQPTSKETQQKKVIMENQGQGALRPCSLEDGSYEECIKDLTTSHTLASTCACKNTKGEHLFDHIREPKNN
jgi:hypothetical protein